MARRHLTKDKLNKDKFVVLVRFMIVAAENKRLVEYNELNKVFGIPLEDLRDYAGFLGDYCDENSLPWLNALIVNATEGQPGEDFFTWANDDSISWGDCVTECFKEYRLPMSNSTRFQNTTGITPNIEEFLNK
jgi:hypothetical protein